ncbi:ImmA/IrrE family metallo-endopeptidase [Streptomyces virginiae]|uniref:ImmA/IrrE family metallo-endopeptidase n=1 Tax=Streptomyces virginiae TaxID=1961 RepID=UPI0037BC77DD
MADTTTVYGHRVRQARTIRQSPIKPLAQTLGLAPSSWTALERSTTTQLPRLQLRVLATALRFPVEFFQSAPGLPIHRGSLLLRAKKTIKVAEVEALTAFAEMAYELLAALGKHATQPPVRLPRVRPDTTPEEAARLTRAVLDLPEDEPIAHVIHAAERGGIPVVVADVGMPDAKHDAFSVWVGEFQEQPMVVARPVNSWERTRWSVAHELGHLVLHRGLAEGDAEDEANRFANEFLLPSRLLALEWPEAVTLSTLMPLKQRWRMSLAALIMHGSANGLLERRRAEGLFKQLSARRDPNTGVTWKVQEPGWAEWQPERPRLLAVMAERGMEQAPSASLFSSLSGGWAPDLMEQVVVGQRPAPTVVRALARQARADAAPADNVVAFRRA